MNILLIALAVATGVAFLVLLGAYICFLLTFYVHRRKGQPAKSSPLPNGDIYEPFYAAMRVWAAETEKMPSEDLFITSRDGLRLHGKFYEYAPGAPIEIMFHGYRGSAQRDLSGGVQRCFAIGHSALIVDQRCSNISDGNVITFGIKEHEDCLEWVNAVIRRFGGDVRIILTGISMGATTVLLAAGQPLPQNVIGVLADCGYTSAQAIIRKVIRDMKLPDKLLYPLVRLGARVFGHFDPDALTVPQALKNCTVPVIFIHGEEDLFVPCEMSRENYEACPGKKALLTVPGAGHGLSYVVDPDRYFAGVRTFFPHLAEQNQQKV